MIENCAIATMDGPRHGRGPGARAAAPLELLLVGGMPVVDGGELRTVDAVTAAREVRAARLRLVRPELS